MGNDKRRFNINQNKNSLSRKPGQREPYERILIICEGETELYYLTGLRKELTLNNVYIKLCMRGTNRATDPMNIVTEAEKYLEDKEYDKVYCVFDNEQSTYQAALNKIQNNKNKDNLIAIYSVPCVEYWFLLHFKETLKPYTQKGQKSPGEQIKSELKKKHIKNYREGDRDIFNKTKVHLQIAIKRAKRIDALQQEAKTDNPSTKIYKLVEELHRIKIGVADLDKNPSQPAIDPYCY